MKNLLFLVIFITSMSANVQSDFALYGLNIQTKSYRGWIRVVLSEEKRKTYGIEFLTKEQINKYVKALTKLSNNKIKGTL